MKPKFLPDELLEQQRKAGRARWIGVTPSERTAHGKLAWKKRVERYQQSAVIVTAGRSLPQ